MPELTDISFRLSCISREIADARASISISDPNLIGILLSISDPKLIGLLLSISEPPDLTGRLIISRVPEEDPEGRLSRPVVSGLADTNDISSFSSSTLVVGDWRARSLELDGEVAPCAGDLGSTLVNIDGWLITCRALNLLA